MAEVDDAGEKPNGAATEVGGERSHHEESKLYGVLHRMAAEIFFLDPDSKYGSTHVGRRIKGSLSENVRLLHEASRNTGHDVLLWAGRGSPFRALLVISVGTIALLALTGLVVLMFFVLATSISAIVISLLVSLAAAGGFLVLFFACIAAIYIGALSLAIFVVSTTTISAIIAALIATGWAGFFMTLWLATKKSIALAQHSLTVSGSALSAWHARHHH